MRVAVVVPFRGGCPRREANWSFLRRRYAERMPDWQVLEAECPPGPWCKGAAIAGALADCDAEIVVLADADVWAVGLLAAVSAVEAGAPWAIPHELLLRLSPDATAAFLAGEPWNEEDLDQPVYKGIEGGGVVVASREVLEAVPVDPRFVGWGQEDECHALALRTLVGPAWRGSADLIHLYHPPQERLTRRRGSRESWELRCRYFALSDDPRALGALIEETRDCSADQHAVHSHAASAG